MNDEKQGEKSQLEESREIMRDMALPPGVQIGKDPDGNYLVLKEETSEVFGVDIREEDPPALAVDLWRDYIGSAPPSAVARIAFIITAFDALLNWEGELSGGPRSPAVSNPDKVSYECTLWSNDGDPDNSTTGLDDDPVNAIIKARRRLLDSLPEEAEEDA